MARKHAPLAFFLIALAPLGCGGLSQDDLRSVTYQRSKDEEEPAPAPPAAAPAPAPTALIPTPAAVVAPITSAPAQAAPAASNPTVPTAVQNTPAQSIGSQGTAASFGGTQVASANPLDLPSTPLDGDSQPSTPAATPEAEDEEPAPPPITEDSTQGEIVAYQAWQARRKAREQAKQEAAEQNAAAGNSNQLSGPNGNSGNTAFVSSTNYNDNFQTLQALFDRLTNPENLSPEELARVSQQLAYDDATKESLLYHNAWLLTTDKVEEVQQGMAWSPALQRPLAAIHWGLGLEYSGDPKLLSSAQPIDGGVFQKASRRYSSGQMKNLVGELGDRMLYGLDDKIETGDLGKLLKPPVEQPKESQKIALKWEAQPAGFSPETLGRGITLLKGGTRKELLYIARLQGIDILVLYEMSLKEPKGRGKDNKRLGPIVNITELKLVDVAKNKDIYSTSQFHNVKVHWARQDRTAKDPVEKEFETLFSFVDESLKLGPIPSSLNDENAKARIETLAASQPDNPLSVLAEMRLYQAKGLVGDATLYAGYKVLIGAEPAKKLITGTPSERVGAISKYLPRVEKRPPGATNNGNRNTFTGTD